MTSIFKVESVLMTGKPKLEDKRNVPFKDAIRRHPTIKEPREKKHPFHDSDSSGMLDYLLEKGIINFQSQRDLKK